MVNKNKIMASFSIIELEAPKGKSRTVMLVNGKIVKKSKDHSPVTNQLYEKLFDSIKKRIK